MQISKTPIGRLGRLVRVHPGSKDDPHSSQQHYELVHILSVTCSQRFTWSTLSISIGPDTNADCAPAPLYDVPAVQPAIDARSESCSLQCSATKLPPRKGAKHSVGNPEPDGTTSHSKNLVVHIVIIYSAKEHTNMQALPTGTLTVLNQSSRVDYSA